jgi:hypothetical protein
MASTKIHLRQDLGEALTRFRQGPPVFALKLNTDEMWDLTSMLVECMQASDNDLHLFMLKEIHDRVYEKYERINSRGNVLKKKATATFLLSRSVAYNLFDYMNDITFDHPLHSSLACKIVDILYRQLL